MEFVIFVNSQIFKDEYHVCIIKNHHGIWLLFDPMTTSNLYIRSLSDELASKLMRSNYYFEVKEPKTKFKTGTFVALSCVGLIKMYLGIKNPHIITSHDLYAYLDGKPIPWQKKVIVPFRICYFFFKYLVNKK